MNKNITKAIETLVHHGDYELLMIGAQLEKYLDSYIKGVEKYGFTADEIEEGVALFVRLMTDRVGRGEMALEDCYRETLVGELARCCLLASTSYAA